MKGIHDMRPLAWAPALEKLILDDIPQLRPDELTPLIGLPHLRAVGARIGVEKRDAARALLGLPEVDGPFEWRD